MIPRKTKQSVSRNRFFFLYPLEFNFELDVRVEIVVSLFVRSNLFVRLVASCTKSQQHDTSPRVCLYLHSLLEFDGEWGKRKKIRKIGRRSLIKQFPGKGGRGKHVPTVAGAASAAKVLPCVCSCHSAWNVFWFFILWNSASRLNEGKRLFCLLFLFLSYSLVLLPAAAIAVTAAAASRPLVLCSFERRDRSNEGRNTRTRLNA